jgi:hypothetical protein
VHGQEKALQRLCARVAHPGVGGPISASVTVAIGCPANVRSPHIQSPGQALAAGLFGCRPDHFDHLAVRNPVDRLRASRVAAADNRSFTATVRIRLVSSAGLL